MSNKERIDPQYVIDVCARHQLFIRGIISHKPVEQPTKRSTHTLIRLYATNDEEGHDDLSLIECIYSYTELVDGDDFHYPLEIRADFRMNSEVREEKLRNMLQMWQERDGWKNVSKGCWFDRVPIAIQVMDTNERRSGVVMNPHSFDFLHHLYRLHSLILVHVGYHWAKPILARRVKGAIKEFERPWRKILA